MSEWWSYSLSDLLMFSTRTYFRLFELYNLALWPGHFLAAVAGGAIVLCMVRGERHAGRVAAVLLGLCWLWVGWAFHAERYATINTAAPYFALGFIIEGLLLMVLGTKPGQPDRGGLGLFLFALLGYPLLALAGGRPWTQAEMFGLAPDPTAAATLAVLVLSPRSPWILWPVPLLWSAISGATLWTMGAPYAWVLPLLALLAVLLRTTRTT
jgi:hypothetical protein